MYFKGTNGNIFESESNDRTKSMLEKGLCVECDVNGNEIVKEKPKPKSVKKSIFKKKSKKEA